MALPAGRYGVTKEQLRKIKRLPINTIGMITETKEGIAIVEDGAKASQLITAGRQFWHNGKLYSADVDIAKDADIITSGEGKNATEMPNITDQLPGTDAEKANEVTIARVENGSNPSATINEGEQFYHSGILYTATQDIATTDTITPNTNCRLSDSVTSQIASGVESAYQLTKDTAGWSGKNQFEITATSGSVHDIAYTVYDNGTVNCNGYSDAASNIILNSDVPVTVGEKYILSDGLDVHNADRYLEVRDSNGSLAYTLTDDNVEFTATESTLLVRIHFGKNKTLSNVLYKPMVRRADIIDDTFEPYHPTVDESKADNSVIGTVEDGANPTKAYAVGEHMIRGGKFCTVTVAVTTSSTWTLGSNYVEGDIAECLNQTNGSITITASGTSAGITLGGNDIKKIGNVVNFSARFTLANAITSGYTFADLGFPPILTESIKLPVFSTTTHELATIVYLDTAGKLHLYNDINLSADTYTISGTYLTA